MASVHADGDLSEISSLTDSSDEGKKVVEEVVETVEEADKPAYSEEDLETLVGFIRGMIILFDYDDEDFNEEAAEVIKLWLADANNPLLFIFYDGNRLTASLAFPLCPINDLMYFMREEEQLFSALDRFHDDILFGTLHGDIEGSLLVLLEQVYGPMILANVDWSENVKANVINGFNAFMTYLTELHYKLSGFTLLYVPREGSDMEVQEVVLNRSMIKRLEAVVIDWTGQIRATLADTQHFVPDDLVCPSDEYSFWLYRHEVLSAIRLQYKGPNVQHIVRILELAQSLYIKHLKDVLTDLDRGIEIAESNIPFLKLLVDPCFAIGTLETADDFCSQLIYVMHIIRFIGTDSSHLNRDESITKLFLYLSNEIVACCMRGIDVGRILAGAPRYGIEVCRMKINCCESYKIIYEEMLEHFKGEFPWNLDYAAIFNRINAFLQRLNDILEICDAMLIFGKYAESTAYTSYRFFCNGAEEFERRCDQVEKIFHGALETIESVGGTILDINNKDWYRHIGEFREMLKSLDDIMENLLSNVFMMSENLEEKLNVLVTLLNFYQRENIRESFMRKIGEVWGILNEEIMQLSKDISAGISQYPALLPPHAGRYAVLKMRFDHLTHHRKLVVDCRFFPDYPQQDEVLALYEACEKQVKAALKGLSDSWSKSITSDMASWYQRNLICRSNLRPGLFEVNIERRLLVLFDEAHYFKTLGVSLPMSLDLEKHENTRLTFDNVLRLVLYFNGVVSSISDKERLFFKPMIQQTERKLEPMRSKLTWEEDLTEFIEGYVVNVRELLDLIELYKRENHKIAALVERMYGMVFVRLEQPHAVSMAQLMASVNEQKKAVFTEFLEVLTEISQNIFTIYDSLGSNVRKMAASWEQYLHKIDKLLKAAIFTCTLNTLRDVRMALENIHSTPILLIEILLKKDGAVYEPSVDAVEQTLRRLVEEVCLTIKPVPSMSRRYQLESEERSFYLQLLEHPDYIAISGSIGETIDDTVRLLRTYQAKWNVFRPFWCVDKAVFIERFRLSAMTSDAFQKNIEKFEELQNQLSTQSDCIVCRSVEIDALKLKYALTSHIGEWQTKYIEYLKCVAYGKIIEFNNVLKRNVEDLRHEPKEVHELKRLEERYQACFEELPGKEQEIAVILKYFVVLEKYVVDLLPEAYELRHNIGSIWAQYLADMKEIREQIDNYQDQFKLSMTGAADALKVDALEMLKMLREEMQTSDDSSPGEAFEAIDRLMMQLEVLERREQEIAERMLLLGVRYVPLPALREIRCTLENLRLVWLLVDEWRSTEVRVMSENYRTVDELELQSTSSYLREAYEKMSQRFLEADSFEVFDRLGEEIAQFSVTVTIVCGMRSSFLQDRHWEWVRRIAECGSSDELSANSSFLAISKMGLYRHERELMALCKAARMEHEVELELEGIAGRVRAIALNIRIPPNVDSFPELLNSRLCFETLEDSIGIINRLRSSPHRLPFQPLVDYWEHTIGILQEILEVLTQMQMECRTLFELYRASGVGEGLSTEMDDFREGFRSCFAQWCELMRHLSSARLVEDICAVGQEYLVELESIRKRINQQADGLRVVLERRRHSFPRFHLLSDRQLIALMSQPTNHSQLEASLAVLFENVSRFHVGSQGDLICGVYTGDEEYIPFGAPLPSARPKNPSPIDETMNQVERGIRDALQDLLCKCHAALRGGYFRRVESGWLRSWPLQLCLKSAELQHTLHTRNTLVQCSLVGSKKPLKMLRSLHAKLLEELTASSRSETADRWQRKKLYDLLIIELNARDLIGRLCRRPELHGLESFEWVSQLHSHLHPTSRRCTVQLLDVRLAYGYECKRSTEPMLLTPASEKARLATMCAIRAGQLPTLLGTSGASCGRRVLLQSLAQSVGVFLLTLDCHAEENGGVQAEALLRLIAGMKHIGGWLAFRGLECLSSATLTQIVDGVRRKVPTANVGDGDHRSRAGKFQLFMLTARCVPIRTVTETLDRTAFRPVIFTPADRLKILECWLWLANFEHCVRIAKLTGLFLEQMKFREPELTESGLFSLRKLRHVFEYVSCWENSSPHDVEIEKQTFARAFMHAYRSNLSESATINCRECLSIAFGKFDAPGVEDDVLIGLTDLHEKAVQMNLNISEQMAEKVLQLHRSIAFGQRPTLVMGGPAVGKSTTTKLALALMSTEFEVHRLIPNVLRKSTHPKAFDRRLLDCIIAACLQGPPSSPPAVGGKCLILDSVPEGEWVECVARLAEGDYMGRDFVRPVVRDENHTSRALGDVKVMVECVGPLETMTPSAVSRFTLLHIAPGDLRWEDVIEGWLRRKQPFERECVRELAGKYFSNILSVRRRECQSLVIVTDVTMARTFCHLWDALFASLSVDPGEEVPAETLPEAMVKLFFFCTVWSVGGSLDGDDSRGRFDLLLREQHPEAGYPLKGNVFQLFVDPLTGAWRSWETNQQGSLTDRTYYRSPHTIAYEFLTLALMKTGGTVLLAGVAPTGKTALMEVTLRTLDPTQWSSMRIALTQRTSPLQLRSRLRCHAMKIMKDRLYPEDRKRLVCFVDDLHCSQSNPYAVDEFVRGLIERVEWYEGEGATRVHLEQCQMVAAMRLQSCGAGFSSVLQSLVNKCHLLVMTSMSDGELGTIFAGMIRSAVGETPVDVKPKSTAFELLGPATVDFVGRLGRHLPPTPARLRYQFSLRTISAIVRSLCVCLRAGGDGGWQEKGPLLRLWVHECYRETLDQLERTDQRRFYELLNETLSGHFEVTLHGLCPNNQSPLFSDLLGEGPSGQNPYEDVRDADQLIVHAEAKWSETEGDLAKKLIIHEEAVKHATRVLRAIRAGRGMLLMGRPGSGRTVVCRLAARLSPSMGFKRIVVRTRDEPEVIEQSFWKLFQACQHQATLVMINVDDVGHNCEPNERLMELLSGMVAGEEWRVLFCGESGRDSKGTQDGEMAATGGTLKWDRVRANFHLVLCVPLELSAYRVILQRYPSLGRELTVDCMHDWPEKSLQEISRKYLLRNVPLNVPIQGPVADGSDRAAKKTRNRESLIQSTEDRLRVAMHELLFRIHYAVQTETNVPIIVPSGWYFELLDTFERVLREKRTELQGLHRKFRVGIERIEDATVKVADLSEELERRQQEIALFQQQLDAFLEQIALQTAEADEQTEEVSLKRVKIGAEEVVCKQLAAMAEADLERAMPALNAAVAALDSLNKKDMNEIKSYSRPPTKVELVMEAVMILLGREPTWAEAKRQLGEQKFLDTLKGFDRNGISERTLKTIGAYVRNPELEPDKVGTVSRAAKSLILWVRAIENYGKVYKYVGPKIRKMEDANASLLEKQNELAAAERKMVELSEKLARLRAEYEEKIAEKQRLEETARQMAMKLERARTLVDNLAGERIRWIATRDGLEDSYCKLLGDSLLAAGFLTYLGSAELQTRASMLAQWSVDLETLEMPFTRAFSLTAFFYEPSVLIRWHENGLPPDEFSAENATILMHSTRTAWIVDPQEEAQRWLLQELGSDMTLVDFDDEIGESTVMETFHRHVPLVVENVNRGNALELDDVFTLQEAAGSSCEKCQGGQSRRHLVYLISRESLPIPASIMKCVNQLSFVLAAEGLEMKMLGLLVGYENPSLEERRDSLQQTIVRNKQTIADLEEEILQLLNESNTPLLEDEKLYLVLENSRVTGETVSANLQHAETTRRDIEASREVYRSCAARAALLFMVLGDLRQINLLYRYSLEWYKSLFLVSLEKSGRVQQVAERRRRIDEYHTYNVFRNVSRGLFENDRKLFGFHLCTRLLFAEEAMSAREYNFLVHGSRSVDRSEQMENPCRDWLTEAHWDQLSDLDRLPGFHGIVESFEELPEDWHRWYLTPSPENSPLPANWEVNLKLFQKYLLVRCLRMDRVESCMVDFTRHHMGAKFVNVAAMGSLEEAFRESSPQTPILLLLRGPSNPERTIGRLRSSIHSSSARESFEYISMTEGRLDSFSTALKRCVADESWLYVGNCHLSERFLKQLPRIVAFLRHVNANSKFRLWLGSKPHAALPVSFLASCIKLAYEEPRGIKHCMGSLYAELGEARFKKTTTTLKQNETTYKRLLFSFSFLHGLLLERNNFQQLGWLEPVHFVANDFGLAESLLAYGLAKLLVEKVNDPKKKKKKGVNADAGIEDDFRGLGLADDMEEQQHDATPWQFIHEGIVEICYGAQIDHGWDRRIYDVYKKELFHPRLLASPSSSSLTSRGWFRLPRDGTFQTYADFIASQLPERDGIDVFGQHENANIKYLASRSGYMLQMLGRVADPLPLVHHPQQQDAEGTKQAISDLLSTLPVYLSLESALRIVGAGANTRTPVSDAMLAEVRALNSLLARVRSDANCALRTLTGATNEPLLHDPTGRWSELFEALQRDSVPAGWQEGCKRESLAGWAMQLRERVQYFRRWTETGQLPAEIELGRFMNPARFLNAVLMHYATLHHVPLEAVGWSFTIFTMPKPLERIPIEEGFIARGLTLENGSWDWEKQTLAIPDILETICPMPPIAFRPTTREERVDEEKHYLCPVFKGSQRDEGSFVLSIPLAVGEQQDANGWILYNTALLLTEG
ncbi:dynein axonemal heavy chain 2-like [Anopheles ziemanni]|uniref:dynein axonemal heavy chain 2-like n=1 Tax=Anopheles coustani TaxID=139045 RepID=UPI00265A2080|nr:dynein axonemal heavy chain 2-like [Anopheles coustani]XP_058168486.1 dynein axonemal heavy chain 2-like [Anopheles ziemanni]